MKDVVTKEERIKALEHRESTENRVVVIGVSLFVTFMLICMGIVEATKGMVL